MINILLDKIIKSINIIALMSFIYTIVRNISMGKYEKKSYWYRKRVIEIILPFLDELEKELEEFIKMSKKNKKETMKQLKKKFLILKKKILIIEIFDEKNKKIVLKKFLEIIENGENKFLNLENRLSEKDVIEFCNKIRNNIYLYEKNNFKL